ncbi:hypothetical protein B0T17DRAFT_506645 [Bombardia bombarda]|uniref:Uncharacterized protein n=1 Tax=Bombardia bombarda TaxID=252184 RepID=A0AA39XA46_9PEZI|nr:hypothetical protein B0T17DRAFT_506645 [Bombardia bombarda]
MSFCVAVQSAVFYFIACTPCTKVRHRQRARQKAKKEREEKARIVLEQPHLYQHPDPFNTNPYWSEEISLDATENSGTPGPEEAEASTTPKTAANPVHTPRVGSTPTVVPEEDAASATLSKTASVSTGDDWNLKRYQREDEELWGEFSWTGQKLMDAIKQASTSAGRFVESKLGLEKPVTEKDRHKFYFSPRNPPVNDYHPPVVSSKPAHKDALRWMLQPPPSAKVMEGKVPVSRSASMMSVGSRRTVGSTDGPSLSRRLGEKSFEAKIRRGELPFEGDLHSTGSLNRTISRRTATPSTARAAKGRRTTRSRSLSTDSGDSLEAMGQRRRRPSHLTDVAAEVQSEDEDEHISRSLESLSNTTVPTHSPYAAQRPRLSTILSCNTVDTEAVSSSALGGKTNTTTNAPALGDVTNGISFTDANVCFPSN